MGMVFMTPNNTTVLVVTFEKARGRFMCLTHRDECDYLDFTKRTKQMNHPLAFHRGAKLIPLLTSGNIDEVRRTIKLELLRGSHEHI